MDYAQNEKQIFKAEIIIKKTTTDHQLSQTFYFIKISCFG